MPFPPALRRSRLPGAAAKGCFDVFADITGLGEHSCIDDRKQGYVRGFAIVRANSVLPVPVCPTITMFDLSMSISRSVPQCVHQPFVMVVDRHRHIAFRGVLPDHVLSRNALISAGLSSSSISICGALCSCIRSCSASMSYPRSMHWSQICAPLLPVNNTPPRCAAVRRTSSGLRGAVMIFVVCHGVSVWVCCPAHRGE